MLGVRQVWTSSDKIGLPELGVGSAVMRQYLVYGVAPRRRSSQVRIPSWSGSYVGFQGNDSGFTNVVPESRRSERKFSMAVRPALGPKMTPAIRLDPKMTAAIRLDPHYCGPPGPAEPTEQQFAGLPATRWPSPPSPLEARTNRSCISLAHAARGGLANAAYSGRQSPLGTGGRLPIGPAPANNEGEAGKPRK